MLINQEMKESNLTERIKQKAKQLFFTYGLKSISMDDIAKQSGVAKKTVYEFFDDKNDLVYSVMDELIQSHESFFMSAPSIAIDAIDEVLKQDAGFSSAFIGIHRSFFYELESAFPDAWEQVEQYKLKIYKGINENLRRGQREGFYREGINCKLVADLRLHQLLNVLTPEVLTSLSLSVKQLADEFTVLYLNAITTEKGRVRLDKYLGEIRLAS